MSGTVLLTGATGLIGRQTIAPLRELGFDVIAASRKGADIDMAKGVAVDLLDPVQISALLAKTRPSHLLHLAWHDHPRDRWTSPANLDWAAASLRLVRGFAKQGGTRALAVGSCAEYEWGNDVLSESSPLKQNSLYGAAKATTGMALNTAAASLDLSLAWTRVFFCYGPGEPKGRLLGDLIKGISSGERVACTDGLQERDFLHTQDIGAALATTLASTAEGPINIASGIATPVKSLIEEVARQMGRPDLIDLGARARPPDDPPRVVADVTRLTTEVGWVPKFDIATGVAQVLAQDSHDA